MVDGEQQLKSVAAKCNQSELANQLCDDVEKKLYHQMTKGVLTLMKAAGAQTIPECHDFFMAFVKPCAVKMNCVSYMQIVSMVADHMGDAKAAFDFVDSQEELVKEDHQAYLIYKVRKVLQLTKIPDLEKAGDLLDTTRVEIEESINLDQVVHSNFQQAAAAVAKASGNPERFFKHALMYLAYTPFESIPEQQRSGMAYEIAVAAILSPDEFNFGELMREPLMEKCLSGSEHAWLWDLLGAFHKGRFDDYEKVLQQNQAQFNKSQDLAAAKDTIMRTKITILALVDMVFDRPADQKQTSVLGFDKISEHCRVGHDEVERLVMRAFAVGLCKGSIDEVDKTASITWLKPRVLDVSRIEVMKDRLARWAESATTLEKSLRELTPELMMA